MIRYTFAFVVVTICTQAIAGEETAKKDLATNDETLKIISREDRFFDFKTTAKGTVPEHTFILENPFSEPLTIKGITPSCTCTTVHYDESAMPIPPLGNVAIMVRFRGDLFEGPKNATLTIQLDKPDLAEIQLQVRGEIRRDIQITPDFIDFDTVDFNKTDKKGGMPKDVVRTLTVTYSGANTRWRLVDTRCEEKFIRAEVSFVPSDRIGIKVYKVSLFLDPTAPRGILDTRLFLVSNDAEYRREIPIPLRGKIGNVITVRPSPLFLGMISAGEQTPLKDVTLLGTHPFHITKIECDDPSIIIPMNVDADLPAKRIHSVPIQYIHSHTGEEAVQERVIQSEVRVTTDIPHLSPTFLVTVHLHKTL